MRKQIQGVEMKAVPVVHFVPSIATWSSESSDKQEKTKTSVSVADLDVESQPQRTQSSFPELHFTYRRTYIFLYVLFLLLCNFVIPCILFYPLVSFTKLSNKGVIGISSVALGISSCFDSPIRLYRLVRHRRTFGPLGNDNWWYLDFTMWTNTVALLIFAIPLAIAPVVPLFDFFLMSTVMLVGPIGLVFFISLFRPRLPFRCSSDPAGERMKPAVFYIIEDVASVDFKHGKEFRRALHARWHASPPFQKLMMHLTVYWTISAAVYCGVTAAVTWTTSLRFAFAWTLGQLFVWAGVSALGCRIIAKRSLKNERKWWEREHPKQNDEDVKASSLI
ncbi:hypothetical protein BDZ97DRAFT_1817186 [Flammula alnicola]|nr:hypothetical protein BDZ97DRAFT_1817186 [Flammula alnicola]